MSYCLTCGERTEYKVPHGDQRPRAVCDHCGYIHYENPKVICGTLAIYQDKVLLCRRAIEPRYGYWTLPAGFMEIGETMAEGAARETMEEAQGTVENSELYCLYNIPYIGQIHAIFKADLLQGQFAAGEESIECALFAEADIPWQDLAFHNVTQTLKHYFQDRQTHAFPLHHETLHPSHGRAKARD